MKSSIVKESDVRFVVNEEDISRYEQVTMAVGNSDLVQQPFRPIHYLGSKLRILDFIKGTIERIEPTGGRVCDFFSGSGTVSKFLADSRPVISVDIQEYSRVLCSALLNPFTGNYDISKFISLCKSSEHYKKLIWAIEPILEHEKYCISRAFSGDPIPLCELIENGSIISFEQGYLENCSQALFDSLNKTSSRLTTSNYVLGPQALVVRYFGGVYFSYYQAAQIDALLEEISNLDLNMKDTFVAAVLSTSSDVVNTVGKQFAQPIKPINSDGTAKKGIASRINKDRSLEVFPLFEKWLRLYLSQDIPKYAHEILRMDYLNALEQMKAKDVKVVYADPPYTRYHYSRYYHVLETICLRDNPRVSKTIVNGNVKISKGIYREERHQSPFGIKSEAREAFDTFFRNVRSLNAPLVLSYSPFDSLKKVTPRVQSIEQLVGMAKNYYNNVDVISAGEFSHSKLNQSDKNFEASNEAELLIVCQLE